MAPQVEGLTRLSEIGRGGFGVVYRAWQEELSRYVAVKVLTGTLDERAARRFTQECRALGAVSGHPNIVPVYSAGTTADGEPFLVMPFCDGGSLSARLRAGSVPWTEAVHIGVLLAGALHTAHGAGILHRDIKPANVLVDGYGNPMLADFGLARIVGEEISRTSSIVATPAFAAPEILGGEDATRGADVYGLAATVLTLIAGHPPFDRPSSPDTPPGGGHMAATVYRVLHEPPVDLRERGVPDAVCAVLERALAKAPARRQASALELATQLRAAQQDLGVAVTALPVSTGVPGERTAATPSPTLPQPENQPDTRQGLGQGQQTTLTRPEPGAATPGTAAPGISTPGAADTARGTEREPHPPTRRQTAVLPASRRRLVAPLAVAGVAALVFAALFFVVPGNEVTPRGVAANADLAAGQLGPDDFGIAQLRPAPRARSAFASMFGSPQQTTNTAFARCLGLPVDAIERWSHSPTYTRGSPESTASTGDPEAAQGWSAQSAVLQVDTPEHAAEFVTRWPDALETTCERETVDAALDVLPDTARPVAEPSVTGLAPDVELPDSVRFDSRRVDAPFAVDGQGGGTADFYADISVLARGDRVLVVVVNSFPRPPETGEAVTRAMLTRLGG